MLSGDIAVLNQSDYADHARICAVEADGFFPYTISDVSFLLIIRYIW
jgi:hypothetical protein